MLNKAKHKKVSFLPGLMPDFGRSNFPMARFLAILNNLLEPFRLERNFLTYNAITGEALTPNPKPANGPGVNGA